MSVLKKWMPSLGELLDRLTILELRHLHDTERREAIAKEISDILDDINLELPKSPYPALDADFLRALIVLAQFNTHIWNNEDNARKGDKSGNELYFTHSCNGVRCRAKDKVNRFTNGRLDQKVNAIAADIPDFEPSW